MKIITLSNGHECYVDDDDYAWLQDFSWHYCRGYASGAKRKGETKTLYMHREIMGNPNCQVDHIDGNRLNNQKSNLRLCDNTRNQQNKTKQSNNTSGYKGVSWHKRDEVYEINIRVNRKLVYLGRSQDLEVAARLYDVAALEYFGEFARLNFPKEK